MCSIAARISANGLECAVHDAGVDVAESWVMEGAGKAADDFEAETLPEAEARSLVLMTKLNCMARKPRSPRAVERMSAHRTGHAATHRRACRHVAAIGDVGSAAFLICLQAVGADDFGVVFRDENFAFGREPVGEGAVAVHVARQSVGFSRADDGLHDRPDRVRVLVRRRPDKHPRILA